MDDRDRIGTGRPTRIRDGDHHVAISTAECVGHRIDSERPRRGLSPSIVGRTARPTDRAPARTSHHLRRAGQRTRDECEQWHHVRLQPCRSSRIGNARRSRARSGCRWRCWAVGVGPSAVAGAAIRRQARSTSSTGMQFATSLGEISQIGLEMHVFGVQQQTETKVRSLIRDHEATQRRLRFLQGLVPCALHGAGLRGGRGRPGSDRCPQRRRLHVRRSGHVDHAAVAELRPGGAEVLGRNPRLASLSRHAQSRVGLVPGRPGSAREPRTSTPWAPSRSAG